jgi:hypothetical protein
LAYAVATVLALVIGIPATYRYGLWGAILGINISDALSLVLMFALLKRRTAQLRVEEVPRSLPPEPELMAELSEP